jgi:glycosyltransferase involved in cell wall biosynthesis
VSQRINEIETMGLREAATVLVHSSTAAELAGQLCPDAVRKIVELPAVFPIEDFARPADPGVIKARYQIGPVDPTILFVGDLDERYGPDLLVKALPGILKNNQQARLVVVGDGNLYWPLRVYARYLLLEQAVRLPGHVDGTDLAQLIAAADVVAMPSRQDTPWWMIQAAWAAGTPLVATHATAPELLEHGEDSVLTYPSENSFVWGIERILFDPPFGRTIADKGRHKLEQRFGWPSIAARVADLMGVHQS